MHNHKIEIANKQIRFVTYLGIVGNILLFIAKTVVGFFAGSIALIFDGQHSLSDISTDIAVLLGVHFGSKEPDAEHPYGHGRIETLSAGFIGIALAAIGTFAIYRATVDIAKEKIVTPHFSVLTVALASIVIKELLYRITKKVAVKSHSTVLYANAWHHRSDAFSSIAVVIGFFALKFGFKYGDQIAAVAVGLMIILVAARILGDCVNELTEGAVDPETIERIKEIIRGNSSIRQWHKLRTRLVGREVFLDLHILVDPDLTVSQAHEISENLETALHDQIPRPVNITVHIEPVISELRK